MLQGTFATLALTDLLRTLAASGKSGTLELRAGHLAVRVHLRDGECCAVDGEGLDPLDDADDLEARLVEVCFAVARDPFGAFRFDADGVPSWSVDEAVPLDAAVAGIERLRSEWHAIEAVIPSLDAMPRLAEELAESLTLDPGLWRLVVAIDGRRSVRDVVDQTRESVVDVCQALKALVDRGAVTITAVPGSAAEVVEPDLPVHVALPSRGRSAEIDAPYGPGVDDVAPGDGEGGRDRSALLRLFSALREG